MDKIRAFCYSFFKLENTKIRKEVLAGLTNFLTLIYAVLLVPEILIEAFPGALDASGHITADVPVFGSLTGAELYVLLTVVSFAAAAMGSFAMGFFVNLPFVQGPSVAIATFVTYTVCKGFGYSYGQSLAIVFISGIIFFFMAITGLEERLDEAIPDNLKYAVAAGIGFFIANTGVRKAYIVENGAFFNMLDFGNEHTKSAILAIIGIILIVIMIKYHIHGAIFIGKILCVIAAIPLGLVQAADFANISYPSSFSALMFKMDFVGLLEGRGSTAIVNLAIIVFAVMLMNIFETVSVNIAMRSYVEQENSLSGREKPHSLEVDAFTTAAGAIMGITNVSTYVESTAGIIEGGRTGLTAVVTGALFLASTLFAPLMSVMPSAATATTLIIAGVMMMSVIKLIDFEDMAQALPAFLTMFLMPLTNSLFVGMSAGFISYVLIHIAIKRSQKINPLLYVLAGLCLISLAIISSIAE